MPALCGATSWRRCCSACRILRFWDAGSPCRAFDGAQAADGGQCVELYCAWKGSDRNDLARTVFTTVGGMLRMLLRRRQPEQHALPWIAGVATWPWPWAAWLLLLPLRMKAPCVAGVGLYMATCRHGTRLPLSLPPPSSWYVCNIML